MKNITNSLTSSQLRRALSLQERIEKLQKTLASIYGNGESAASSPAPGAKAPRKRRMSAAGRAAIRAGAKARWAKYRAAKKGA